MRKLIAILGVLSLILGVVGAFLPLLPTTPFILLSAYLFAKSSPTLESWLLNHRFFGSVVRDFRFEKSISLRAKILSVSLLWFSILSSIFFFLEPMWLKLAIVFVASLVTWHILHFKTKRKNK